jgi:uncharacterized protein (DUF983 family)
METMTTSSSGWAGARPVGLWTALKRGLHRRCPRCGRGSVIRGYLTMREACSHCGLELEPYRADDVPAYFTVLIVGHLVVPGLLLVEQLLHPPEWAQMAIWLPFTLLATLAFLPFIKGAVIAAIWRSKER